MPLTASIYNLQPSNNVIHSATVRQTVNFITDIVVNNTKLTPHTAWYMHIYLRTTFDHICCSSAL